MTNKQLLDAYVVACNQESVCRAEQKRLNEKADKLENEVLDRMNSENLLSRLPPHASQLLRDLNAEFYGGHPFVMGRVRFAKSGFANHSPESRPESN